MNNFIQKLTYTADIEKIARDLDTILENWCNWAPEFQIGLRHRPQCQHPWKDSVGGLTNGDAEAEFSEWNKNCPEYVKWVLEDLAKKENIQWGRIRFMLANPKQGLSMHRDFNARYHLVIKTNPSAIFGECFDKEIRSICYHIPDDSHWYKVDTVREHFVYNGGWTPRIHLVCCPT